MSVSNQLWTSANLAPASNNLMEQIVDRRNLVKACKRVVANKGNPGVDNMSTQDLPVWLQASLSGYRSRGPRLNVRDLLLPRRYLQAWYC